MIPYTTERRPDTRVTNVALGMWLFIASEVMLFGALFSSYALLRVSAPAWPRGATVLSLRDGIVYTVLLVLITSNVWRLHRRDSKDPTWALGLATGFAVVFVALKVGHYRSQIAGGLLPSTNTFLAMYYVLTGMHALHVVGGAVANLWTLAGRAHVADALTAGRVRALTMYWTFVDIVWVVIFVLLYLS